VALLAELTWLGSRVVSSIVGGLEHVYDFPYIGNFQDIVKDNVIIWEIIIILANRWE